MSTLCSQCKFRPPREGLRLCEKCASRAVRRVEKLKKAGRCTCCGKPSRPGKTHCQACSDRRKTPTSGIPGLCSSCVKREPRPGLLTCQQCADKVKRHTNKLRKKGLCIKCGEKAVKGYVYCGDCRAKQREANLIYDEEQVLSGMCCKHPDRKVSPTNRRYCTECSEERAKKSRDLRAKLKVKGICTWCAKAKATIGPYCETHHLKVLENRRMTRRLSKVSNTMSETGKAGEHYMSENDDDDEDSG